MDKFLSQINGLIDRYGVKSVVAGIAIWQLGEIVKNGLIPGIPGAAGIVVITVGFFIARHLEHQQELDSGECEGEDE